MMKRPFAGSLNALAQEISRRLSGTGDPAVSSDPHGFLIRTAAEVEQEWEEERARRLGIDQARTADAESAPTLSEIRAAVTALPKQQREILGLHLEGLTYQQIARQTVLAKEVVLRDLVSAYSHLSLALDCCGGEIGATAAAATRDRG